MQQVFLPMDLYPHHYHIFSHQLDKVSWRTWLGCYRKFGINPRVAGNIYCCCLIAQLNRLLVFVIWYLVLLFGIKTEKQLGDLLGQFGINPSGCCNIYCCQSKMPLLIGSFDEQSAENLIFSIYTFLPFRGILISVVSFNRSFLLTDEVPRKYIKT